MTDRSARLVAGAIVAALIALPWSYSAQSPATVRVSVSSAGTQGDGSSASGVAISADGRHVAFESLATNLVGGDTNRGQDIFVRDRLLGRTVRVSVATDGSESRFWADPTSPAGGSSTPSISDDGRYVAFYSSDAGLVSGDNDNSQDVFVRDRDADGDGLFDEPSQVRTLRASIRSDGSPGTCAFAQPPCFLIGQDTFLVGLSGNGRHVVFSTKQEFVVEDTNGDFDLYSHDLETRRTVRLMDGTSSLATGGARSVSRSGRFVLARRTAPAPAGFESVAVLDRDANANGIFDEAGDSSVSPVPRPPGPASSPATPEALSPDGVLVVFGRVTPAAESELWIWHRIGNVTRRLAAVPSIDGISARRLAGDNRRLAYETVTGFMTGTVLVEQRIVTFDADGDGHFDDQASIGSVALPQFPHAARADFDDTLRYIAFGSDGSALVPDDTNNLPDVFVHDLQSPAFDTYDTDGDGLANTFEARFGLSASSSAAGDGASGDPDGDGRTNAQEQEAGTHPRGFFTRYLAEGATGSFFSTRVSVANPSTQPASVLLRYQTDTGHTTSTVLPVPAEARRFVNVGTVPSLSSAAFSTVIESDREVVVDRSMFWADTFYGSHAESSVASPATTWYFAEGATHGFFELFYLLQNPSATDAAQVEVRYLLPVGAPVIRTYVVPPSTRLNILVDSVPGLEATDVSAVISGTNNVPVIAERAMYFNRPGQAFGAGHASAGVTAPATTWFLAEGATGSFFDLFVLVANPEASAADVRITYLRPAGAPIIKTRTVPGHSRSTIYVESEAPELADTPVSTVVESTNAVPVVVERAMWWPTPGDAWQEAHNSFGATQAGVRWGFADGEVGNPPFNTQTYFLIANAGTADATVRVKLLFEDGPPVSRDFVVPASTRFNVPAGSEFPEAAGRGFGAIVESLGVAPSPIVVERAMYSDSQGVVWAAGTNALGTRLP